MALVIVVSSVSANHTGGVEGYVSCGGRQKIISQRYCRNNNAVRKSVEEGVSQSMPTVILA